MTDYYVIVGVTPERVQRIYDVAITKLSSIPT